jgi:acetylornithine/succinyldiaminopimelate/putrescine aminotransferase
MGAVLLTERVAQAIRPGDHATTFGGGPLVASAALAVCRRIGEPAFLAEVRRKGAWVEQHLSTLRHERADVVDTRGAGLLWGVEIKGDAGAVVARALDSGLLLCTAGANVVRIAPPLIISDDDLEQGFQLFASAL